MESIFSQALALHRAGRLDEAEALYRQAGDWRPGWTLGNLGMILRVTGRLEAAEAVFREALAADPANLRNQHSLALTLLQLGRYAEGWPLFESRLSLAPPPVPTVTAPPWRGEPLRGKRLLVVGEQGLGDQILFARFIRLLADLGADVVFAASRPLLRLFEALPAEVFNPQTWDGVLADHWVHLGSTPLWLGAGPQDAPAPFLHAGRSGGARGRGLMLEGGATNPNPDRLPPAPVADAIRGLGPFVDLSPAASGARDFLDTAEIVAGLDEVVTVDTSVAHLAGALGKPTRIIAPRPAVDWYTRWDSDRTPWYPAARVVRQRAPGDWASVIQGVAAD